MAALVSCRNMLRTVLSYRIKFLSNNIDVSSEKKISNFFNKKRKQRLLLFTIRDYFTNSQLSDASNFNIIQKWLIRVEYLEYKHFCFVKRKHRKNRHVQSGRNRDCAK